MGKAVNKLSTPVVLIIFNRPETTSRVFEEIRKARPEKLYIVADGPRPARPDDVERCAEARSTVESIDWECDVVRLYAETNMGCGRRIASGLDLVFSEVDEAIILEDDCVPAPSLFNFCSVLLDRYRADERIMMISGNNFQGGIPRGSASYYFSKYTQTCGWATWSRSWRLYDYRMARWPEFRKSAEFAELCNGRGEKRYWTGIFDRVYGGTDDIWDYQFLFASWVHGRLAIAPQHNLVTNIGFGGSGTHVMLEDELLSNQPVTDIWEIIHPDAVEANIEADLHTFRTIHKGRMRRIKRHLLRGWRAGGLSGLLGSAIELASMTLRLISMQLSGWMGRRG